MVGISNHAPNRINAAVRECMSQCARSKTPVLVAADYLDRLEDNPEWTADDIREVRLGIGHALVKLVACVTEHAA